MFYGLSAVSFLPDSSMLKYLSTECLLETRGHYQHCIMSYDSGFYSYYDFLSQVVNKRTNCSWVTWAKGECIGWCD